MMYTNLIDLNYLKLSQSSFLIPMQENAREENEKLKREFETLKKSHDMLSKELESYKRKPEYSMGKRIEKGCNTVSTLSLKNIYKENCILFSFCSYANLIFSSINTSDLYSILITVNHLNMLITWNNLVDNVSYQSTQFCYFQKPVSYKVSGLSVLIILLRWTCYFQAQFQWILFLHTINFYLQWCLLKSLLILQEILITTWLILLQTSRQFELSWHFCIHLWMFQYDFPDHSGNLLFNLDL